MRAGFLVNIRPGGKFYIYNDVNNHQEATTFTFINLFKLALHVSGDKFAHSQEHFWTVYTAFGTIHRHCCRPQRSAAVSVWHRSATMSVYCTKSCIYSPKVILRMGEFVARNMLGWFKKINERKICCVLLVVCIVVLKWCTVRQTSNFTFILFKMCAVDWAYAFKIF